jgi:hypothetical protein
VQEQINALHQYRQSTFRATVCVRGVRAILIRLHRERIAKLAKITQRFFLDTAAQNAETLPRQTFRDASWRWHIDAP